MVAESEKLEKIRELFESLSSSEMKAFAAQIIENDEMMNMLLEVLEERSQFQREGMSITDSYVDFLRRFKE